MKPKINHLPILFGPAAIACWIAVSSAASGQELVEGFTEPNRTIQVAAAETGLIMNVFVREGEQVRAGQPLALLDDELHRVQLNIAKKQLEAKGRSQAVQAEFQLHKRRYEKLVELRRAGQSHPEEVERAFTDLQIAESKVLAEEEEQALLRLQFERAKVQLDRRTILAPIEGTVLDLLKNQGEFVSPASAQLLTLVELAPLKAVFLLPRSQAVKLKPQQTVKIRFGEGAPPAVGTVDVVSDVTDAQSGLVTVKVRLDNARREFRSGERCRLEIR